MRGQPKRLPRTNWRLNLSPKLLLEKISTTPTVLQAQHIALAVMGKRPREPGSETGSRKAPKNSKMNRFEELEPPAPINSVHDLLQQLQFTQQTEQLRKGQIAFKAFLISVERPEDGERPTDRANKLSILRDYLDSSPTDMLQTWSYASEVHEDGLESMVTSNFALLLRALSSLLEFREQGLAVIKSLLQSDQIKLMSKALEAESRKEHIISPCLRILTEALSFDGGSYAPILFKHQQLFSSRFLDRNLRMGRTGTSEDPKRPSVRSNTIKYLIAQLRFQDLENRIKIVDMRTSMRNWLESMKNDPTYLVKDSLRTIESRVLRDKDIPRKLKSGIMSDRVLAAVLDHIRATSSKDDGMPDDRELLRAFIQNICTDPDLGVLLPSTWYPAAKAKSEDDFGDASRFDVPDLSSVRNPILSKFIQHLKPHAILSERELLVSTLSAAPELVADYIRQAGQKLSLVPKLTNTWIGYASLIYSVVDLAVPRFFGHAAQYRPVPPPKENVLENILPSPLTREVLTKCLNQSSDIVRYFALRVMVLALRKFNTVIGMYEAAAGEYDEYAEDVQDLITDIRGRLPAMRDVLLVFTKMIPESEQMSREAASHLLSLQQQILSNSGQEFGGEVLDVAAPLASVMASLKNQALANEDRALLQLQLTHLLVIAEHSYFMRWWQRLESLEYSAFVTITQLCTEKAISSGTSKVTSILASAAFDNGLLQSYTQLSSMDALIASLETSGSFKALPETWTFIDDCINRFIKKPIKYLDDIEALAASRSVDDPAISCFAAVLLEQMPFTSRMEPESRENVLTWVSRFVAGLASVGEDKKVLSAIKDELKTKGFKLSKASVRDIASRETDILSVPERSPLEVSSQEMPKAPIRNYDITWTVAPQEPQTYPELVRYKKEEVTDLVHGEVLPKLFLSLCSSYPEIRKQGFAALEDVQNRVKESNADYKDQIWLLIIEVLETSRSTVDEAPLSYVAGCLATAALKVQLDAKHFMFRMINRFLLKDPYWHINKLPSYYLGKVLAPEKDEEENYWAKVEWVLTWLLDGLRRPADVKVLSSRNCFERILNIVTAPQTSPAAAGLVFQIVHRAMSVGGAPGLIMNAGLGAWIEICSHDMRYRGPALDKLKEMVEEASLDDRVREWKGLEDTEHVDATED